MRTPHPLLLLLLGLPALALRPGTLRAQDAAPLTPAVGPVLAAALHRSPPAQGPDASAPRRRRIDVSPEVMGGILGAGMGGAIGAAAAQLTAPPPEEETGNPDRRVWSGVITGVALGGLAGVFIGKMLGDDEAATVTPASEGVELQLRVPR